MVTHPFFAISNPKFRHIPTLFAAYAKLEDASPSSGLIHSSTYFILVTWEPYEHVRLLETQVNRKTDKDGGTSLQAITEKDDQHQVKLTYLNSNGRHNGAATIKSPCGPSPRPASHGAACGSGPAVAPASSERARARDASCIQWQLPH